MNMRGLVFLAAVLLAGCSFEDDRFYGTPDGWGNSENQVMTADSTDRDKGRTDSLTTAARRTTDTSSVQTTMRVTAHVVAEDGQPKVTIRKILLRAVTDGDTLQITALTPLPAVAEPDTVTGWDCLPPGVEKTKRILHDGGLTINYRNDYTVYVALLYTVRVRDNRLAMGYTVSEECAAFQHDGTVADREKELTIDIPITLNAVMFDGWVGTFD